MTLRSRRQPFRRPFSAPIFFFHSRRIHSRIHPIRRLWCTGRPFLLLHRRRVLDRFSETRDSLLRSRCLATRRSRRRRAANGRRRSPHRCRRRRRSSTPILLSRCSPLSRERGLLRRHHVVCSTRVDRDDNTRERERERERDVRSFKTPGEGSSAPSSSSSSSSSSASSSSFQSSALPRENNNALSKKNPILFFLS